MKYDSTPIRTKIIHLKICSADSNYKILLQSPEQFQSSKCVRELCIHSMHRTHKNPQFQSEKKKKKKNSIVRTNNEQYISFYSKNL